MESLNRRKLLASAGVATGTAAIAVTPSAPQPSTAARSPTRPVPPPEEAVVAYVRDAKRGEVTVLSGTSETTYRDRALVKRLMKAAREDR